MTLEYWESHAKGTQLELLDRPCSDCAIITNFYTPFADELLDQSVQLQDKVLKTWFCHNHNKACRGAYNYVHMKRKTQTKVDRCCECSFYKPLTYSQEEKLWLCVNCEVKK